MPMRTWPLFALLCTFFFSACTGPTVQVRKPHPELQQGLILIQEPTVDGSTASYGIDGRIAARVQRSLISILDAQDVRITTDPSDPSITVTLQAAVITTDQRNEAQNINVHLSYLDGGTVLATASSGRHSVWKDLEQHGAGNYSLDYLTALAMDRLNGRPLPPLISTVQAIATTDKSSDHSENQKSTRTSPASTKAPKLISGIPQRQSYALIIGVESYRDLPAPTGARQDAERFAELAKTTLGIPNDQIRVLLDDRATRGDILAELRNIEARVQAGSRIYLFFSGHGSPDTSSGSPFLLPYESTPQTLLDTALPLADIVQRLEATNAREVVAFLDTCFSGTGDRSVLPEGIRPLVPIQQPKPSTKTLILSAAQSTETSGTRADEPVGLFTHYLIEALGQAKADLDGDGQISMAELQAYISPRVAREARQLSREQNPSLYFPDKGSSPNDFAIVWGVSAP